MLQFREYCRKLYDNVGNETSQVSTIVLKEEIFPPSDLIYGANGCLENSTTAGTSLGLYKTQYKNTLK